MDDGRLPARLAAVLWAVLLTALVGVALVLWGPAPVPCSEGLFGAVGWREPRDRAWVAVWLLLPPALMAACRLLPPALRRWRGWLALAAGVLTVGAVVNLALPEPGPGAVFSQHTGWWPLALGWLGAALLHWGEQHPPVRAALTALGLLALVRPVTHLFHLPGHATDSYHLPFVGDELLAFAAGHPPLLDYSPTYTAALGLPLVPLIRWLGLDPMAVVTVYLFVLDLLLLGAVFVALVRLGGWRHTWLYALVVAVVPLAGIRLMPLPALPIAQYVPVWPVRLLVPALCLAALAWWRTGGGRAGLAWPAWLGGLAGAGLLCNLDFGLVNGLALGLTVGLLAWRDRQVAILGAYVAALASTGAAAALLFLACYGRLPDLAGQLAFMGLFSRLGVWNFPIPPHGIVVPVLAFATGCFWLAAWGLVRDGDRDPRLEVLLFAAAFTVGTMGYYSGKSLGATVMHASALWAGVCAALCASIWSTRPGWPGVPSDRATALVVQAGRLLPTAAMLAFLAWQPPGWRTPMSFPVHAGHAPPPALPPDTATLAPLGNLWTLRWGLPNSLQVDHPGHIATPVQADCYCEQVVRRGFRALWVAPDQATWETLENLSTRAPCRAIGLSHEALAGVPAEERLKRWHLLQLPGPGTVRSQP